MASLEGNEPDYGAGQEDAKRKALLSQLGAASGNDPASPDQNVPGWNPVGTFANAPTSAAAPSTTPTSGSGGGTSLPNSAPAVAPQPSFQAPAAGGGSIGQASAPAITDQVTALLQERLRSLSNPMDITTDPIYQNQIKANEVITQRDADRDRAQLAERAGAQGWLSGGGFNSAVGKLNEQRGEQNQQFSATLAGQRFQQREAQLNQAISMARAVGQDDVAMQLENQKLILAQEALDLQRQLGFADIGLRSELGHGQLDLGYGNLGLGYGQLQNQMNQSAVYAALGGG